MKNNRVLKKLCVVFAIIFAGYLQSSSIISTYMHLLFGLFALTGMSISLIIKISMISRNNKCRKTSNQYAVYLELTYSVVRLIILQ